MSNDYKKGYDQGQLDGADGDNKLAARSFKRLFSEIGSWLPGFDNRDDQYRSGYLAGFEDRVRIRRTSDSKQGDILEAGSIHDESRIERESKRPNENGSPATTGKAGPSASDNLREGVAKSVTSILSGGSMSNATSFAHQIELLEQLKKYLGDFQERLLGVSGNYQRKLDELHGEGMMDETHRRYIDEIFEPTRDLINKLVEHIASSDIPRCQQEIDYLDPKS